MEYGHESEPRQPFEYRLCPFCGHRELAVYWDIYRFQCHCCQVQGKITREPGGDYPSLELEIEGRPLRRMYG